MGKLNFMITTMIKEKKYKSNSLKQKNTIVTEISHETPHLDIGPHSGDF